MTLTPPVSLRQWAKFLRETADDLIEKGAFLQAADGEGVVAIFGFPNAVGQHAEDAVRAVLDLTKNFRERRAGERRNVVRLGHSSRHQFGRDNCRRAE